MVKRTPHTRVVLNGVDISSHIFQVNLPRFPSAAETVELTMEISGLEVDRDGTLIIKIDTPDGTD